MMALPDCLQSWISIATTAVRNANFTNARILAQNASAYATNIRGLIEPDGAIDQKLETMVQAIQSFTITLERESMSPKSTAVEEARNIALSSIEATAFTLKIAKPNDVAKALALGW